MEPLERRTPAHDMALLYHITGNKAYADDAVKTVEPV